MSATDKPATKTLKTIILMLAAVALIAACVPANKKRTTGTVVDDQSTEVRVYDNIYDSPKFTTKDHVKLEVHNGTVLLAGETVSEENKTLATSIASGTRGVTNVVNELAVMPAATAGGRLDNSYITSKANSVLTIANPVEGMDATRIKVITARKIVYLMGTVTRAEGDRVADVVRNISGVEKVVKVFDYVDA
ncbi:MAG TPA: BON domain-containing protein [Xanthomonadales bacterium]|nr:BON domain-containing protein [Xanthomonadales bacterium]